MNIKKVIWLHWNTEFLVYTCLLCYWICTYQTLTRMSGIKNDFSAQLHKFLATLTDTRWKLEGKTVLYIPTEGTKIPSDEAAKNKELVQRLESKCLICAFYYRPYQLKRVLSTIEWRIRSCSFAFNHKYKTTRFFYKDNLSSTLIIEIKAFNLWK